MMKIWFVRHGETDANAQKVFQGWMDRPLNAEGRRQAQWLQQELQEIPFRRIYASPLQRAWETATIIRNGLKIPAEVTAVDALKELNFGQWEGLLSHEIAQRFPEEYLRWLEAWEHVAPPDGESAVAMFQRVCGWFDRTMEEVEDEEQLLIVTHEGVILQILAHLIGLGLAGCWHLRVDPGSVSQVERSGGYAVISKLNHKG